MRIYPHIGSFRVGFQHKYPAVVEAKNKKSEALCGTEVSTVLHGSIHRVVFEMC